MQYDADQQPDPTAWLELDESERIDAAIGYHARTGVELENIKVHAIAHVMVENQIAQRDPPLVSTTLARLMDEGLDRHDAIHAVGSVLVAIVFDAAHGTGGAGDSNTRYNRELAALTAASWRAQADEPAPEG